METLWLGEAACHDPSRAGGKAASLSRLSDRHRVPPGFCIPASVHARWMQQAIRPEIPPADLLTGLADAYRALSERCGVAESAVAVRSSATDEDGATASFAGQYETI